MEILRTLSTTAANDADEALLDNWPAGKPAEGIYVDLTMPVTVGVGGTPTASDLKNCLAYFLGQVSLSYGANRQFKPYIGVDGGKIRNLHRLMTMVEVWNDFVGVVKVAGAQLFRARLFLTATRQKADGRKRYIGSSQGRTMFVQVREGDALTAGALGLTRTALTACQVLIVPAYRTGRDTFTHLPHYREVNRAALDVSGPDGKTLAVWDDNAAFSATAITKYSARFGADELLSQVEPKYGVVDYRRSIDAGGADISDEVTPLYMADPFASEDELATGAPYIKLVSQDVASIKARFVYFPNVDESDAATIAKDAAALRGEDVIASIVDLPDDPSHNGHAATASLELLGASDSGFGVRSGVHADAKGNVRVHVPQMTAAAAKTLPEPLRQKAEKLNALMVPGATSTSGKGAANTVRSFVRSAFGG
jgi:hypothetical protein